MKIPKHVSNAFLLLIFLNFIDAVRQTKTKMENLEKNIIDDLWNVDEK